MNKKYAFALLTGFALATVAFFTMGQSRAVSVGRYEMSASSNGAFVVDTSTGAVKFVSTRVSPGSSGALGIPFEQIPSSPAP